MKYKFISSLITSCLLLSLQSPLSARSQRLSNPRFDYFLRATNSAAEHYACGCRAMKDQDWCEAIRQFRIVVLNYVSYEYAAEAQYQIGIAFVKWGDLDLANREFSKYLREFSPPEHFEEIFCYKFQIAEAFRKGAKRHLFSSPTLPPCMPAYDLAIELYDEIATTLPNEELAPKSMYYKGLLTREMKDYKDSNEALHSLIRRYPNNPLSSCAYLLIAKNFYNLARCQPNNPDLLALALINIRRFGQDFPGDIRVNEALKIYCQTEEIFARGLFEMGEFYVRTEHPKAAEIYFMKAAKDYPDTKYAQMARNQLVALERCIK